MQGNKNYYPLTYAQRRVYLSEKTNGNRKTSVYTIGGCLEIEGQVDLILLEQAIIKMIQKYDAFQIRLKETEQGPRQYFSKMNTESLPYYNFSLPQYKYTNFYSWCNEKFKEPFPMEEEKPLYYFCIFKTKDNRTGYFFKLHHIIADGWSINLILQTVASNYECLKKNENQLIISDLRSFSYLNYIASENKYINSKCFERDRKFWLERFQSIPEPLFDIKKDRYEGKRKEYRFSPYTENILNQIMKEQKVSISAIVSALTAIYYMGYYGKEEIIIGIPVYNREKATKKVCGLFTSNTLLRLKNYPNMKLGEYVTKTGKDLNLCYYHQKYPYDLLVRDIELQKKGQSLLYQIAVNYYNTKLAGEFSGMKENNYELYGGQQFCPLQIVIKSWDDTEGTSVLMDYQTEYFTENQLDAFMDFLENGIYLLGTRANIALQEIPLITEKSKNEIIYGYNSYFAKRQISETVLQKIERQSVTRPKAVAVSWEQNSLTYEELNEKAEHLAAHLQSQFGKSQQIIAVITSHSVEYVIAVLAILKAGYAFLPVDPEEAVNRIAYMLKDAGVVGVLTDQQEVLSRKDAVQTLDLRDPTLYANKNGRVERTDNLDALAYIIYTSGSSGNPKGVLIGQRSFSNYVDYAVDAYIKDSSDVFAFFTSISFDFTITSIFVPLASGTQIRIYKKSKQQYELHSIVEDNKATIIKMTPSHLALLNEYDLSKSIIRTMILGGEKLLVSTVTGTYRAFGHKIDIFNEYGPTEATIGCMTYLISNKESKRNSEAIGYPISNTELYVLNQRYQVMPKGAVGELFIAGDCLALGYLNKPEITSKSFVQHFIDASKKMYRTGDIVRLLDNGTMEYIGRANDYIKFKGYRIEIDEIEKTILLLEEVNSVAVICMGEWQEQAIYAFATGKKANKEKIRAHCIKTLPKYMIPQFIEVIDQIPLTRNGKTDYKILQELAKRKLGNQLKVLEGNEKIETFLSVFRQILQNEKINITDNFFTVGGDSIKAIQASGMFNKMNKKLLASDILSCPNFLDLYRCYCSKELEERVKNEEDLNEEQEIPMTPIMEQYFEMFYQEKTYYNQSILLKLHERVEIKKLNEILKKIVVAHDMLHIRYDRKRQRLIRRKITKLDDNIVAYNQIPQIRGKQLTEYMKKNVHKAREGIDLENGVTLKGILFENELVGEQYLFLTIHHLGIDLVSWRIILDDLSSLLADEKWKTREIVTTVGFLQWAKEIREKGPLFFKKEKGLWEHILTQGKCERVEEKRASYKEVKKKEICFSKEDTALFSEIVWRHYHMKLDESLLSILGYCLMEEEKREKLIIMTESHGRDDFLGLDSSRTVGWFTSMYPILLEKNKKENWEEEFLSLKEQVRKVTHCGIGYGVNKWLVHCIEKEIGEMVCFNYIGDFVKALDNRFFTYEDREMGDDYSQQISYPYKLELNAMIVKDELRLAFSYVESRIKECEIQKLIKSIKSYIKVIINKQEIVDTILTPSDFETVSLSSEEIDFLFNEGTDEDK